MSRCISRLMRLLLGLAFVGLSFYAFGNNGEEGVIVSTAIAVPMFVACSMASRDQFGSTFVLITFSTIGFFIGLESPPIPWRYSGMEPTVFAIVGCAIGLVWVEWNYRRNRRSKSAGSASDRRDAG